MSKINHWKNKVQLLKTETYAIYLASKDPRVPWYAKALIILVMAHTFSPIDLIPDFIPLLGYLDDMIIAPLGIVLAIKMIPQDVLDECRKKAQKEIDAKKPGSWYGGAIVILIWLIGIVWVIGTIIRAVIN